MNPYAILAIVVLWGGSVGGAFLYGSGVGKDGEIANQAKINQAIIDTREAAQLGAADAIAKIKVTHKTIQGRVETTIRDNPVYRDCLHSDSGLRLINEAITGKSQPASDSKLPRTDATEQF